MTEYKCKAIIDLKFYEFLTMGVVTQSEAQQQFKDYLYTEQSVLLDLAEQVSYHRVMTGELH